MRPKTWDKLSVTIDHVDCTPLYLVKWLATAITEGRYIIPNPAPLSTLNIKRNSKIDRQKSKINEQKKQDRKIEKVRQLDRKSKIDR